MKLDKDTRRLILVIVLWAVALTVILATMSGCKTCQPTIIPEIHEIHDTIIQKERYDSIIYKEKFVKDSVSFSQKNDTIKIERWHWERDYSYEKILQHQIDSLLSIKRDSIPYPVPGPKEYINELKKWQKALMWWGVISFLCLLFYIYLRIRLKKP